MLKGKRTLSEQDIELINSINKVGDGMQDLIDTMH